ncbi:MAG: hypothetical protein HYW63_01475 [Candidatus Levybacteria bacterium]|nr:hypothetical protein [Candidatus Levybacteria bacterium]
MKKHVFAFGLSLFLFASYITPSFAVSLSVDSFPSSIDQSEEAEVGVTLLCSGCKDSYLRGVFYPTGTSYFGYTQHNAGTWSNAPASGCTTFFKVEQADFIEGSWSGTLKIKPDKDSSYYKGPSEYFFKVGRYTSSCGSATWSEDVIIAISGPTPTPIPINTPTPTKSPTPTKIPTQKKTAASQEGKSPTKTPTPKISLNSASSKNTTSNPTSTNTKDFARISTQSKPATHFAAIKNTIEDKSEKETEVLGAKDSNLSFVPVILGILLITVSGGLIAFKNKEIIRDLIKIWIKR